jgi:hypothetical protein
MKHLKVDKHFTFNFLAHRFFFVLFFYHAIRSLILFQFKFFDVLLTTLNSLHQIYNDFISVFFVKNIVIRSVHFQSPLIYSGILKFSFSDT